MSQFGINFIHVITFLMYNKRPYFFNVQRDDM